MVNTVLLGGFFDPATPDSAQAFAGHGNSDSSRILEALEPRRRIQISSTSERTMPAITRPVRQSDIPAMAAIRAQEWATEDFWAERIGLYLSGKHSPQQALATRGAFVAVNETEVVGFVAGHLTRRLGCDGELQWINVAEASRGCGIADELMATMGAWFFEHGARRVCVNVDPANAPARKLYSRFGAKPLNDHWMVWEDAPSLLREEEAQ